MLMTLSLGIAFSPASSARNGLVATSTRLTAAVVDQEGEIDAINEEKEIYPGLREDTFFECDDSVSYWKEFISEGNQRNLQRTVDIIVKEANSDNVARAYWASHLLRTGYFTFNALAGSLASDLHERFIANRGNENNESREGIFAFGSFSNGSMVQGLASTDIPTRLWLEVFRSYAQDYKYVKAGLLKTPWDALVKENGVQLNHKQSNPLFAITETMSTVRESIAIFSRRNKQSSPGVYMDSTSTEMYPDYYLNDFHYQTDGWLSSESAKQYEASTETLFLGRQDAMQRQTLIPILKSEIKPETILEVACGTGRFGTFMRDNFPTAKTTFSDLSPYYLEKAKANDEYWMSQRGEDAMEEVTGEKKKAEPATFVQANAETLPFEDDSFDVVTCVYLFHELPEDARARAAKEMVRVVKKGGMIVLSDSLQLGDRPPLDEQIGNFSKLNEPHYVNYVNTYLPDLFEGCEFGEKLLSSSTKTLSFIKK